MFTFAEDTMLPTVEHTTTEKWLDKIPQTIDMLPSILPDQSNIPIVPSTENTKEQTWWDQKQYTLQNKLQDYAQYLDGWFGESDPNDPASANLRMILDNEWNKYDDFSVQPRIRGKVKLPTLKNRFSIVFGDDTLDNEIRNHVAMSNENPRGQTDRTFDKEQSKNDNASLALRWSHLKKIWDIQSDVDLGIRSGNDIYLRLKGQKDWDLGNDFSSHAEQIYRYGLDSQHYLRTNLEIRHAKPNEAFLSDQLNLTYTDNGEQQHFSWDNRLFRQHQFFHQNQFSYGVYVGGKFENSLPDLNSYGPFISWRQPIWREWLFVQSEVNYYNHRELDRTHTIGALLRLETWF
jgi:hypothetical protein